MDIDSDLMINDEAAKYLGVCKGTLPVWRHLGRGPKYVRIGRNIRYRKTHLDDFISEGVVQTVTEVRSQEA